MFTWRELKKQKKLSPHYFANIFKLISNQQLYKSLKENNITLYFTLHHKLFNFKEIFINKRNIKYIEENDISECLSKISLVISDFSSIIFDVIYRRKPFIIYIPDAFDSKINEIYKSNYYEIIESIKNGTIKFENKYFEINDVINKTIFYINNKFILDSKLIRFYNYLGLKKENSTNKFINYITNLK